MIRPTLYKKFFFCWYFLVVSNLIHCQKKFTIVLDAGEAWERIVHPYQLRQYNNRWFLVGTTQAIGVSYRWLLYHWTELMITRYWRKNHEPYEGDIDACFKDIVGVSLKFNESCRHIVFKAYPPNSSLYRDKAYSSFAAGSWATRRIYNLLFRLDLNYESSRR